ncbi:MAG: LCP family protein [Oscillospiraceae bacterium]|nr:LCP family protein [Oscillospiraceae bacterium]
MKNINSSGKNNNNDIFYMSTKGRRLKKFKKTRKIINIAGSLVLAVSVLATVLLGTGFIIANTKLEGFGTNETESGDFEPIMISKHSGVSYILVCGVDLEESLTDIMAIACIDHEKNTVNFLQIPRDTFIGKDIPSSKLNAVYSNPKSGELKINALRRRLASYFGIPIDHYVLFTIKGFRSVVDALGGLDINITQEDGIVIEDQDTFKHYVIGPGWVTLDGNAAAGFVRKRAYYDKVLKREDEGYKKGDTSRLEAQRLVYVALAKKLQNMSLTQMATIATTCYDQISTDMSFNDILGYAKEIKSVPFESMKILGVPGQACDYNEVSYYSIHKADYVKVFNDYFNPYGEQLKVNDIKVKELHTELGIETTNSWIDAKGTSIAEIEAKNNQ